MKHFNAIILLTLFIIGCQYEVPQEPEGTSLAPTSEIITYGDGFSGYLVTPPGTGPFPGVVMIHEWWGLNEHIKNQAMELANEGFTVLAVDLYDGKVTSNSSVAGTYAGAVRSDPSRAIAHMKSAVSYLREDSPTVGSLGWCFGGGMSLQLALNEKMDATAMYYGAVVTNETQLMTIGWPVLGVFGEDDQIITVSDVKKFDAAMDTLKMDNEVYIYPGVGHAFANPSNPGHDRAKTEDAWKKTVTFLKRTLNN